MSRKAAVDLNAYTPEAMSIRASLCGEAAEAMNVALAAIRELHDQDATLAPLKLAMTRERNRLAEREVSLIRRRSGMMAD